MRLSGGWSSTTRSPWSRGTAHHIPQHQVGGRQQQDHHGVGGGAAHHIPHHREEEFAGGKHPGGVVLFKNSERIPEK